MLEWRLTVDLIQTWLFRDGGCRVFVERTPMMREVQLLMNIHVLIPEDLRPNGRCSAGGVRVQVQGDHSHTTPRSATSRDLERERHNLFT